MYFKLFEAGADSKRELKISSAADVPEHLSNFVKAEVKLEGRILLKLMLSVLSLKLSDLRVSGHL